MHVHAYVFVYGYVYVYVYVYVYAYIFEASTFFRSEISSTKLYMILSMVISRLNPKQWVSCQNPSHLMP